MTRLAEWRRDLALLGRLAAIVVYYATTGVRLRRAYRRCEARGETLWLDAGDGPRHRDDAVER
jgi:hypothetical protein